MTRLACLSPWLAAWALTSCDAAPPTPDAQSGALDTGPRPDAPIGPTAVAMPGQQTTVESADGRIWLILPSGAVESATLITVAPTDPLAPPAGFTSVTDTYLVTPEDLSLSGEGYLEVRGLESAPWVDVRAVLLRSAGVSRLVRTTVSTNGTHIIGALPSLGALTVIDSGARLSHEVLVQGIPGERSGEASFTLRGPTVGQSAVTIELRGSYATVESAAPSTLTLGAGEERTFGMSVQCEFSFGDVFVITHFALESDVGSGDVEASSTIDPCRAGWDGQPDGGATLDAG